MSLILYYILGVAAALIAYRIAKARSAARAGWLTLLVSVLVSAILIILHGKLTDARSVFFHLFSLAALVGAVLVISMKNPVHCALSLVYVLLNTAGLFLVLEAEFLAVIQVIIYVGAIIVLYLFIVMMINIPESVSRRLTSGRAWAVALLGFLVFLGLGSVALQAVQPLVPAGTSAPQAQYWSGGVEALGNSLFRDYLVPFEVASVILLVALVGAVVLAHGK